jgi:hypothetical protein
VVPTCCYSLQDEAWLLEEFGVRALPELVGGEAVAIGGERFSYGRQGVGRVEPGGRVEVSFDSGDLFVDSFGDEEIDPGQEVFDEALDSEYANLWRLT